MVFQQSLKFGGKEYRKRSITYSSKLSAQHKAKGLRATGNWQVRMVKQGRMYALYTRPITKQYKKPEKIPDTITYRGRRFRRRTEKPPYSTLNAARRAASNAASWGNYSVIVRKFRGAGNKNNYVLYQRTKRSGS